MRTGKGNREEEEYEEDEFGSKKEGPSTSSVSNNNNSNNNINKDSRNNDKASAIRSKHSVTERRRRSKINERSTSSVNAEHKYMMRNSHWRVQNFVGQPQAAKNGSVPGSTFHGKFDENNISLPPTVLKGSQNLVQSDPGRDVVQQAEIANKGMPVPIPLEANISAPTRSDVVMPAQPLEGPFTDALSTECPITTTTLNHQDEVAIEGGIISISSIYSEGFSCFVTKLVDSSTAEFRCGSIAGKYLCSD